MVGEDLFSSESASRLGIRIKERTSINQNDPVPFLHSFSSYFGIVMTPPFIPPSHFAAVQEGLYRGSFPDTINYPFLESYPFPSSS